MLVETIQKFFEGIDSFTPPEPFALHKLLFWGIFAVLLLFYSWYFAKKPLAGLLIFGVSVFLYSNDFFREIVIYKPGGQFMFNGYSFWIFFAIVLLIDSLVYTKKPLRSLFLFVIGIFFYHKTSPLFFLLLVFTIHMDYIVAILIHRSKNEVARKMLAVFSITVNLAILCYFKYAYFFTDSYNNLFNGDLKVINHFAVFANNFTGHDWFRVDKIILPIGLSFYTFQTISYIADVYNRRIEPERNLLHYGFYLSFFPQILLGPITRASYFLPQIHQPYFLSREQFGFAVFWILNGLVKKLFICDYIAINFIDRVYVNPSMYTGLENFLATIAYSLQVYCDFSGFTDIATGVALLMGFKLTQNFNSPYKAEDVGDFWRRWHISLSSWLRDYLYIPLGGNRTATKGTFFWIILIGALVAVLTYIQVKVGFPEHLSFGAVQGGTILLLISLAFVVAFVVNATLNKGKLNPQLTLLILVFVIAVLVTTFLKLHPNADGTLKAGDIVFYGCMFVLALFAPVALSIYLLQGNRFEKLRGMVTTEINMMLTMLIGGLWHGSTIMFIIWGGLNGLGLVVFKRWKKISPFTGVQSVPTRIWGIVTTLVFISFTRIFFRSENPTIAKTVINQIVYNFSPHLFFKILWGYKYVFLVIVIGFTFHWLPSTLKSKYRLWFANLPLPAMAFVCTLVVFILYQVSTGELQKFIYFQF